MANPDAYSRTQIILHWTIAALVLFQVFLHDSIVGIWRARMDGTLVNEATPNLHVAAGLLIFALVAARLGLRLRRGVPAHPAGEHPAIKFAASATHALFYVLLLGMPLSGAAAWFLGVPQPALAHVIASKLLIALIGLHVAAALAQHFWFRTNVLRRMLGMS